MGIDAIDAIDTIEEGIEGDFLNRGSVSCQNNRPSEALFLASAGSKLRFRLRLRLHGVAQNMPSPMAGV